jgi:predicted ester cyclase
MPRGEELVADQQQMGSPEDNKTVVRRLVEDLFNTHNLEIADEVLADGYVDHTASHPDLPGAENVKRSVSEWLAAFPDTVSAAQDILSEGDRVAVRWSTRATHRGEFMDVAPTGNPIDVTWFGIFRLSGGRIIESWDTFNAVEMMQQLKR